MRVREPACDLEDISPTHEALGTNAKSTVDIAATLLAELVELRLRLTEVNRRLASALHESAPSEVIAVLTQEVGHGYDALDKLLPAILSTNENPDGPRSRGAGRLDLGSAPRDRTPVLCAPATRTEPVQDETESTSNQVADLVSEVASLVGERARTARDIAQLLSGRTGRPVTRRDVNRVLYANPDTFAHDTSAAPLWQRAHN